MITAMRILGPLVLSAVAIASPAHASCIDQQEPRSQAVAADDRLDPDRPHLPEASTAVGKGRLLLEGGYTFSAGRSSSSSHAYPEALLRIGLFADWFEFRIGQSLVTQQRMVSAVTSRASGAQDLYLGVKLAATVRGKLAPRIALIPQLTVPTGSDSLTGGRVLPGLNVDGSWEINDRFGFEVVVGANGVADGAGQSHPEFAVGVTPVVQLNRRLEAFAEWDVYYPWNRGQAQRQYAVGGLVCFLTRDLAIDFRAGVGLNGQANRFLVGTGFAVRH